MPRVVMTFEKDLWQYRLVDQRPMGSSDTANCVIERLDGYDAMGQARWMHVPVPYSARGDETNWDVALGALLNRLADCTVQHPNPSTQYWPVDDPEVAHVRTVTGRV